uniref:FMN hydroxy acid dehydrogenase domain-containing protein n=1 Tax=Oryza barthii TaxID=65489 RepID=A0A0D3GTI9_9ORYZ
MEDNLPVNVREYQELAKKALPKMAYDYINGGAEDEHTLRENIAAYTRIILRPRVLVDVSKIDMSTTLLGYTMRSPIIVAPTGGHKLAHPEGEKATARAAASCNAIMVLSFSSSCKIEDVASSCNAIRFYQLYVYKNRNVSATLVRRAESCGFKALLLTVDTPMLGRREADIRNKMVFPRSGNLEGLMTIDDHDTKGIFYPASISNRIYTAIEIGNLAPQTTQSEIRSIGDLNSVPLGTTQTNGSQLERFARATLDPSLSWKDIEWLKSITSMPIFLKGIVTAEDGWEAGVLRAGGRGEAGARHVIEMLNGELEVAMALCGCRSVGEITRSHVMTEGDRIRSLL